ncbi:MAG: amidohydrolase family protein, partial [Candidatus Eremiobacteraeota bacterium]|nr:amidohydrolase family protein [Candidatus Eremiobacteraeota bacterium]
MQHDHFLPADTIVLTNTIHTIDPQLPRADAFAIAGGRFMYVGGKEGALMLRGPKTEIIEFENATILPGIVDAHVHLPEMGQALHEADLRGATSFDDAVRRTVEFARKTADRWIIGAGWDQNLWAQKNFPAHDALSAAV